jgi:hypothetical protein
MRHVDKDGPPCARYPELGPCWLWTGSTKGGGYGQFNNGGRNHQAHRWLYERIVGPVPIVLDLDHFACDRPRCVRPGHVRPASRRENVLRGDGPASQHLTQAVCSKGHPLSGANLKTRGKRAGRDCLTCHRDRQRAYLARLSAR